VHATRGAQAAARHSEADAPLHPHACMMQSGPGMQVDVQSAQSPVSPQAAFAVPATQRLVVPSQQPPPLQLVVVDGVPQVVVHTWVVVLHARPAGQSASVAQPQVLFD
jgi:hypothetical protein